MKTVSVVQDECVLKMVPLPPFLTEEAIAFLDCLLESAGCPFELCVTESVSRKKAQSK